MPDAGDKTLPIRPRSILLGLLLIPVNCYWIFQIEVMWYAGHPTTISLFFNVILFLVAIALANGVLHRVWPSQALNAAELVVIYVMLSLASAMCGHDMIQVLTPILCHPFHFATAENNWAELFCDKLPRWLMVDSPEAVDSFYSGGSSLYLGQNWRPWLPVVLRWTGFLTVLVFTTVCLNVLFRKEWTENERLAFPVVGLPHAIATRPKALCWNAYFLIGFLVAGSISLINGLHHLVPAFPYVPVKPHNLWPLIRGLGHPWTAAGSIRVAYYPSVIGISFLMPLDLMFSCWFFYLFWRAEAIFLAWIGVAPKLGPYITQQATGGYLAIAAGALWIGRSHLKEVIRKVLGRPSALSDQVEPMSYRAAALGAVAGFVMLIVFSCKAGMSLWIAVAFFALYLAISAGITRMRATCGPPAHDLHHAGPEQVLTATVGTANIDGPGLGVMSLFYGFNRAYRGHPMAHSLEGFKLAERTKGSQRAMLAAQMLAVAFGCLCSFWAILHICYSSASGPTWVFTRAFGREPYRDLQRWLLHPTEANGLSIFFYGLGFLIVLLIPLLRWIYVYVPFHPIGFAISTSWSMGLVWFPIFIAWLLKRTIVKYGGGAGYRRFLPFFMGLVLGDYLIGGLWCLIALAVGRGMYAFWP